VAVQSYAQCGEDLQIAYLLGRGDGLTYIDVGCLWPIEHSNTYFFYERGGSGLCIDPNPDVAVDFTHQRPRDLFLQAALGRQPGTATYRMHENPVFNTFSDERAERVRGQAASRSGRGLVATRELPLITLDEAIRTTAFADRCEGHLDFLTVDVEGLEQEVLGGFSFAPLRPRLVVCEHLRRRRDEPVADSGIASILKQHGYWLAAYTGHDVYFLDG